MGFMQATKTVLLSKIFNYSSRAQRSEFWWFMLASFIIGLMAGIFNIIPVLGQIICALISLWLFLAGLSVSVRRLHDVNLRGWWILAPYGLVILGGIMFFAGGDAGALLFSGLMVLAGIAWLGLLVVCFIRGTLGPNRFGPDPLA